MTPRERAEKLVASWSSLEWPTNDRLITRIETAIKAAVREAVEARTISDRHAQLDAQLAAANKRATTAEHERDELRIAVGAPEDFAICSHRRFKEMARSERDRDEALATIADFHKSRIRKQTEREAAMDAEITRLARTVDRKDEQMAELQEHLTAAEAAMHEQAKMLRALERERDEARAERDYEHAQLMKMSEHEIALCEDLLHRGGPITCGVCGGNHLTLTHFEAPAPAQPAMATAAKEECLGCAKVARHPGEGYVCFMHYEPPAAPPAPAARDNEEHVSACIIHDVSSRVCKRGTRSCITVHPEAVISSNRETVVERVIYQSRRSRK